MAKNNRVRIDGIDEFKKVLDSVGKDIEGRGQLLALSKAADPIYNGAKDEIKRHVKGTEDGFSKLLMLASLLYKRRYKGGITIAFKSRDTIPVKGLKGRDGFFSFGWAKLMAKGRKGTAKTTLARKRYKTGTTEGKGDFLEESFNKNVQQSIQLYKKIRIPEIKKVYDRAVKKHMKNI
jgi:hypothetical protein